MQRHDFARLVLQHQGRLRMFIRLLGATPDAVDDLAQDAFVIAYERLETLDDEDQAGPWLRSIARNLVRNESRKSVRRRRVVSTSLSEVMMDVSDESIDVGSWSEDWFAALHECVERLPREARSLVDGRYRNGHTATQLAGASDSTPQAVRQSLCRVRERLRKCVQLRINEATA